MNIKNIFEHKNYPAIMYLSITIVLILIFFSFINILEKAKNPELKKEIITGYTASDKLIQYASDSEKYSKKAFNYYYFVLVLTYQLILIISILLTYRIKKIFKPEKLNDI